MAKSRLIGSYPVIGIRPTIDGRRGALDVRGSLEELQPHAGVGDGHGAKAPAAAHHA